ncbi:MAG: hypothetical protein H7Z21_20575, partial [Hymenobacter sp.]|nr:hypothetical protein [Hymenobacter sp.]
FGILGVLLVLLVPLISLFRRLRQSRWLAPDTVLLVAYFGSLLLFGTSYDWSTYHFGVVGLLLAALAEPRPPCQQSVIMNQ